MCDRSMHGSDIPLTNCLIIQFIDSSLNLFKTFYRTSYLHIKKDNRINRIVRKAPTTVASLPPHMSCVA